MPTLSKKERGKLRYDRHEKLVAKERISRERFRRSDEAPKRLTDGLRPQYTPQPISSSMFIKQAPKPKRGAMEMLLDIITPSKKEES